MTNFLLASGEGILNWIEKAVSTWNGYLAEITGLLTTSPQEFRDGAVWNVISSIYGGIEAVGLSLLVLFFVMGVIKTCGSFTEIKRPEHAFRLFIRFILAKALVTYGMELIGALFTIGIGIIERITGDSMAQIVTTTVSIPDEVTAAVSDLGFFANIGTWLVAMIGSLLVTVLSIVMLITVYGRFFKIYIYTALAPIPFATFAGEPTQNVGRSFVKSFCGVLLEGAVIALACVIFSAYTTAGGAGVAEGATAFDIVWSYLLELIINLLVLVSIVKIADRIIREMIG